MILNNLGFYSGAGSIPGRWMTPKYLFKVSVGSLNVDSAANWTITPTKHVFWNREYVAPEQRFNYASTTFTDVDGFHYYLIMGGLTTVIRSADVSRYQATMFTDVKNVFLYQVGIIISYIGKPIYELGEAIGHEIFGRPNP